MLKRISFMLGLVAISAASFYATSSWLDRAGTSRTVARPVVTPKSQPVQQITTGSTGTYCELTFPLDDCPAFPRGFNITPEKKLRDAWDGADKSAERCMRRAAEFHSYCKFPGTVTARFFSNGSVMATSQAP